MEAIEIDFDFDVHSYKYGRFLTVCYESYPEVLVKDVTLRHVLFNSGTKIVSVNVPEDLATILKLQFGDHIRIRPEVDPIDEMKKQLMKEELETKQQEIYYSDYITKINYKDSFNDKLDSLYTDIKQLTMKILK